MSQRPSLGRPFALCRPSAPHALQLPCLSQYAPTPYCREEPLRRVRVDFGSLKCPLTAPSLAS